MKPKEKKWFHFLSPQYWPLWLAFLLLYTFSYLPYPIMIWLGKKIGRLLRHVSKKHKRIAAINLRLCFPELSEAAQDEWVQRHFESLGIAIMEVALAWWASDKKIKKLVTFPNDQVRQHITQNNTGLLLISGHFTTVELLGRVMSMITPVHIFIRQQNNLFFDWFSNYQRSKYIRSILYKSHVKSLAQLLTQGQRIGYFPDQHFGNQRHNACVPFFRIPTSTTTAPVKLAQLTHAKIIPVFLFRNEENRSYTLEVQEPLKDFPSGDDHADTACINQIIEMAARKHPEQYLWIHRRFKKRLEEEKAFYD